MGGKMTSPVGEKGSRLKLATAMAGLGELQTHLPCPGHWGPAPAAGVQADHPPLSCLFVPAVGGAGPSAAGTRHMSWPFGIEVQDCNAESHWLVIEQCHMLMKQLTCLMPRAMSQSYMTKATSAERPRRFEARDENL